MIYETKPNMKEDRSIIEGNKSMVYENESSHSKNLFTASKQK